MRPDGPKCRTGCDIPMRPNAKAFNTNRTFDDFTPATSPAAAKPPVPLLQAEDLMKIRNRSSAWSQALWLVLLAGPRLAGQVTANPLQINTTTLPNATLGTAYVQQIAVTPGGCMGTGTAGSSIDSGALPPGLSVVSPAGMEAWAIQGTPTSVGTFPFTLHITWSHTRVNPLDPNQTCTDQASQALFITVVGSGGGGGGGGGGSGSITVDRPTISTTYHTGHFPPQPETVHVTAPANAAISYTTQTTTANSGNWLSVTPTMGVTPAVLSVNFSISGMAPGVYTGTVTIQAAGGPATIAVTLTVVTDTTLVLQANPTSFTFSYFTGGQTPPSQSLTVGYAGDAMRDSVIFEASITLNGATSPAWLQVSPTGAATPATLTVSVNPKNLTPGTYTGAITLKVQGVASSAQTIPVTFNVQSPPTLPTITANGVVNAASVSGAIAPGAWVSIFGTNLSATTRPWAGADFVGGKLPLSLDGVAVTINGKAAAVAYVSPTQINVLAPDETATGLLSVQVNAPAGNSNSALALEQTAAPAFFEFRANTAVYVVGTHADGSLLAGAPLVQQGTVGTPAKPGETIVLYGTGFGATQPPISAIAMVPSPLPLAGAQDLRVRIAGLDCVVAFAGLISPGLYQFNVVVPQVADGDQSVVAELRGLQTRADLLLTVQH